ncbi:8f43dc5d-ec45-4d2e-8eb0-536950011ab3-CDS [Sclerotinia trifoliorum]|uniref:8f43dc5d-ec45-4d2e-8eb0-536950011ab3-CDS n=1 Tax=Sclerotinia trifoliorum TaxID=28548 RepID=A0A8H2W3V6_9HELO|nr:8f43dc5d-ec45-4d2e-8eb0-536950011ab3-CDS [Sclerotinia trifoliorum]
MLPQIPRVSANPPAVIRKARKSRTTRFLGLARTCGIIEDDNVENEESNYKESDKKIYIVKHKERYTYGEDNQNRTSSEPQKGKKFYLVAHLKDSVQSSEPGPTATERPRNLHIPITISDDRSEDSDIKNRFLFALQSRPQSSSGVTQFAIPTKRPFSPPVADSTSATA